MWTGLVLGLNGAGKTLLLRQLIAQNLKKQKTIMQRIIKFMMSSHDKEDEYKDFPCLINSNTQPSIGVEHWSLKLKKNKCMLREVGGQLVSMWPVYFESCHFWFFLIDASNPTQLADAAVEFYSILNVDEMRHKPKLLVINHIDASSLVNDEVLQTHLCLDRLVIDQDYGPIQIIKVSALTGENVGNIFKWLDHLDHNSSKGFCEICRTLLRPNIIRVYPVTK
ncbi:GTP-binding ADP-ribosylation factor-like protein ARL1 [Plasmopara halstedii]|uniref:GTP-binding ADP-ribosylation factor-like protein ARL1 n=1 Tax=Plasmopara halstedii TaxID=4781 RepID=A0A0P1AEQ4_PLAHL|nr:GTP-binding ADP-ribosylation factor-like protein ARL1 [Plasmopara halstedii]CEG39408.1 GTP-binding ADP-ribosylation factor-like protein ARL1 [Plasmopara halstedii]|eukprot:XP_024575777.1 GTP-binding ADP-ribosylation factor-like protein ARL1 [Plasmopara halstedii]